MAQILTEMWLLINGTVAVQQELFIQLAQITPEHSILQEPILSTSESKIMMALGQVVNPE
jgi:hypothetical protein